MNEEATVEQPSRRLNLGSWLVLTIAIAFICGAIAVVLLVFRQPGDGWRYDTNGALPKAQAPQVDGPTPLLPGDEVLAIDGKPIADFNTLFTLPPPPNWRIGGTAHYTIRRDGHQIELDVPLQARPPITLFRYIFGGGGRNFWPIGVLWYVIGFGVFLLRPRQTAARLLLLFTTYWTTISLVIQANSQAVSNYNPPVLGFAWSLLNLLWTFMFAMMIHFVLAFPVRKWPLAQRPHLTLGLLYGVPVASQVAWILTGQLAYYGAFVIPMIIVLIIALLVATWHNLRRSRDPIARAQIGWVALGLGAPVVGIFVDIAVQRVFPSIRLFINIWGLFSLLMPLCISIAITRYRLFDIEVIIRRTLVYSALTLTLGLIYVGCILVGQALIVPLLGSSELAIVASTLAIAALFFPLRRRIQNVIDRRFYRRKYNAQQVLAQFALTARDETDLQQLTDALLRVADETMQPEFVGLWLRPTNVPHRAMPGNNEP